MTLNPADWFRGSLVVARRDFFSNVKSVRVLVVSLLTLLIMVGAAFGLQGFTPFAPNVSEHVWASAAYPSANASDAGIVVRVADPFGRPHEGVEVALGEPDPGAPFRERDTNITDADGWTSFPRIGSGFWPLEVGPGRLAPTTVVFIEPVRPARNLSVLVFQTDLIGDGAPRDVNLLVLSIDGTAQTDVDVAVNGTVAKATDANGFAWVRLDPGTWRLTLTALGDTWIQNVFVAEPLFELPIFSGPDSVLYFLAFGLMGLFAPIVAIAVSYDALAKERLHGSLEILLSKPASRTGLAVGKFLGTFASVTVPMVGVLLGSLVGIAFAYGGWPDAAFGTAFVLGTLALIATYVLIMQLFSTFVRSPGSAILSAIVVWLVFNVLWSLVYTVVSAVLGVQGGTPEAFTLSAITALFNPSGVYQLTLLAFAPASLGLGGAGGELPGWSGPVAFALWIVVLLAIAVVLFKRKIV